MNNQVNKNEVYNSLMVLEDIRKELEKVVSEEILFKGKLTDDKLSIILGQGKKYIYNMKRRAKKNPSLKISINLLESFKLNLESQYGKKIEGLKSYIKKYHNLNDLPIINHGVLKYHPDLKLEYFKIINSNEKAYWLGWLYAEAFLTKAGKKIRFGVEIGLKDKELLIKFCKIIGFNLNYVEYTKRDNTIRVRFTNNEFANCLIEHGIIIGKKKSNKIELPHLDNRELYLSFLLGYYDGDGIKNTTIIVSGSLIFLKQIKEKFNIKNILRPVISRGTSIRGIKVIGKGYRLALGSNLFNEILDTISNEFPDFLRKRRRFETYEERMLKLHVFNFDRAIKKKILTSTEKEIQKFAWELGKKYKLSYNLISQKCEEYNIKKPPKDYWGKKYFKINYNINNANSRINII